MSSNDASMPRKRRPKKVLSPSAKYEIWLQLLRGEATIGQAATTAGVDRSTIMRLRQVAKDGALAALAASKPGTPGKSVGTAARLGDSWGVRPRERPGS